MLSLVVVTSPVGPEQRHHVARRDQQVHPVDCLHRPVTLAQVGQPDRSVFGHRHGTSVCLGTCRGTVLVSPTRHDIRQVARW